jgi:hypothetical protein
VNTLPLLIFSSTLLCIWRRTLQVRPMKDKILIPALVALALTLAGSTAWSQSPAPQVEQSSEGWGKEVSLGGVGLTHAALYTWAYFAWYRGRDLSDEIIWRDEGFLGVDTYAGGADKFGHMFSNYALTRGTAQLLRSGGWSRATSVGLSSSLSLAFFTMIEIKDGYHENFGFSWGDMAFNGMGIGLAALMETVPRVDKHFDFRLEYLPTRLFMRQLVEDGALDAAEDYSGQTFLLAHHLSAHEAITQDRHWSWVRYLDVVAGFGSRNYLPKTNDPDRVKRQEVFLGLSLNMQEVLDQTLFRSRASRQTRGYGALRFATEVVAVPYTTLPVLQNERFQAPQFESTLQAATEGAAQ